MENLKIEVVAECAQSYEEKIKINATKNIILGELITLNFFASKL